MNIARVIPNISTQKLEENIRFYTEVLSFRVAMDMEWIITLCSPTNEYAQISLIRSEHRVEDAASVTISIEVGDVDCLYEQAAESGFDIAYPITTEPWGVRRFSIVDPNGITINVMMHHG